MNDSFRKELVALDQRVLIISDIHLPHAHQDWYHFLSEIKNQYKPELIINVGDEIDGHSISFHDSDQELFSASKELEYAIEEIQHLKQLFPKMYLCESNHGSLIFRRMKHHGLPLRHLKSLQELYNTPQWSWHHEIILETHIGNTLIVHGKTGAYHKLAMSQGCNAVQGHFHQRSEVTWSRSSTNNIFNMFVGCLINEQSLAFAYGKNIAKKPIISLGWLNELGEPSVIRMILDKHGRWIGKL